MEKCGKTWRQRKGTAASQRGPDGAPSSAECSPAPMMRACSACAGDYEDPDRTAWTTAETNEAGRDDALNEETEEFPAEE